MKAETFSEKAETLTYHGDHSFKAKCLAQGVRHRDADQLSQGSWTESNWMFDANFRGCSIGCSLAENGLYARAEMIGEIGTWAEFSGWPLWLSILRERFFESLKAEDAPQWHVDILSAVPVGASVSTMETVRRAWLADILDDPGFGCLQYAGESAGVVQCVVDLLRSGAPIDSEGMKAAASAAAYAARVGTDAADAAADAADAARAATDATDATDAAYAAYAAYAAAYAADAAAGAAGAAAYAAARKSQAGRILDLLRASSVEVA